MAAMKRLKCLDLFCGVGGASAGYDAVGFDVTGVDLNPSEHYPYPVIRADALTVPLDGYDLVAASPPCQRYSRATPLGRRGDHPDLLAPIRARLGEAIARGVIGAYVIENVPGAPMCDPITVCGWTLRLPVRRHRLFEASAPLVGTGCCHDASTPAVPVYGSSGQRGAGGAAVTADMARQAMGISWAPWDRLTQAVPPAYTAWVGTQIVTHLRGSVDQVAPVTDWHSSHLSDVSPLEAISDGSDQGAGRVSQPRTRRAHRPTCQRAGCGAALSRPDTGRWPRYCSHACRQAAYRDRKQSS